MTERKSFGNVAVRIPSGYRLALTALGRKPLTPEVEKLLIKHARKLSHITVKAPPATASRTFVSIRADLADNLREIARDRRTSAGALLYSLITSTTEPTVLSQLHADLDAERVAA
jgi:hypothetical protein